jgi:large subunit ribosomal protein L10
MTREQKVEIVDFLSQEFKSSQAIVVCDYKGTTHKELEELRVMAAKNGAKVQVAKNTLVRLALKNAEMPELELEGTNIFVWSEDQISACKTADKFASTHKDTFAVKSGIIEGEAADIDRINQFAKLPSRDELIGMLLSVWTAPIRNFVTGLDNLRSKKEEEAA